MLHAARPRHVVTALLASLLLTIGLAVTVAAPAGASSSMLAAVNSARADHGKKALSWNGHLASVAQQQADRMARKRELYHNPNLASDVGNYRWVGENVGYGPSIAVIQSALMKSPGHRANILDNDFTQIGIGSVRDSKGRLWVAQVFRRPSGESAPKPSKPKAKKTSKAKTGKTKKADKKPRQSEPSTKSTRTAPRGDAQSAGNAGAPGRTTTPPSSTPRSTAPKAPKAPKANKPRPAATPPPATTPTLAQRVESVRDLHATATDRDPITDTLAFAAAMNAVAA